MNIIVMRGPCQQCGTPDGVLEEVNGQDTPCAAHGVRRFATTPPRPKLVGKRGRWRSGPTSPRANAPTSCCATAAHAIICHSTERLEVGHLISVADGARFGLDFDLIHSDENLAVMCATCNSGISDETVPIRLIVTAFMVRVNRKQPGTGEQVRHKVTGGN